jgi:RNA polymerase sporulation-specific sigma factor
MPQQLAASQAEDVLNCDRKLDLHICQQLLINTEHLQRVKRIARKYQWDTSVSWEDAAQAAHEKVLQAVQAGKFRAGGIEEFYHWAAKVALRAIVDFLRKHKKQSNWQSLDQNIPGTDLSLLETIAWEFNLLDAVERTDLVFKAIEALSELDQCYPERGYLKLWQGQIQGKNQSQLAAEFGVTQGAISKRCKELSKCIAEKLGLLQAENLKQELQINSKQRTVRTRSDTRW